MASAETLDFSRLTSPLEGDSSVGTDLRLDTSPTSLYYQVKDARSGARAVERQAMMNGEEQAPAADWGPVIQLAPELLATETKDLEIAAYLIEGLVREHGFAGLRDGFRLLRELVTQFGDAIYPLPDEDGIETRVAPLTGLNGEGGEGTLIGPINNIPITGDTDFGQFSASHYHQAVELDRAPEDVRARRIDQGAVSLSTFQQAVAQTSSEFYQELVEDIDAAIEEFGQLSAALDEKYGHDAPPTSAIRNALQECRDVVQNVARDKLGALETDAEAAGEVDAGSGEGSASAGTAGTSVDAIQTREDAFRVISRVADFFRRTEPHTPISYALDRIVRWGRMPLPQLLREIISDESSVDQMFRLVGIDRPSESESEEY